MLILYAMPASYYSARVRCYLRKRRLPFEERSPGDPRFLAGILPVIGQWIIPVLVEPDGGIVQDSAEILERLDRDAPSPQRLLPEGATGRVVAHLVYLLGGEGLLKAAMHYRWSFEENLPFLRQDFALSLSPPGQPDPALFERAAGRMRKAAVAIGVRPETSEAIEQSYLAVLDALDRHLAHSPYLLGDRPTLADYGLISPLYAHLGRDPVPATLMKNRAARVARWVERMNAPEDDRGEYGPATTPVEALPPLDEPCIVALLRALSGVFGAELRAHADAIEAWLADTGRERMSDGTIAVPQRTIGMASCSWQGVTLESVVMPYRLMLLQRVQDAIEEVPLPERAEVGELLEAIGLGWIIHWRCSHRLVRRAYREIFVPR